MFKKRAFAYLIDVLIVVVILIIVDGFIPMSNNYINLNNELVQVSDNFVKNEISFSTYFNQMCGINHSMDKEIFFVSLIDVVISIFYFIVLPLYNKGQTFGKKLMKIKIVEDGKMLFSNSLIIRYFLMSGFGVSFINLCTVYFVNDFYYNVLGLILLFLQFLVVIISVFMVLYRNDRKSLPDLIAGTKVIEVKK